MPRAGACLAMLVVALGLPLPAGATPCDLRGSPSGTVVRVSAPEHGGLTLELDAVPLVARFRPNARAAEIETLGALHVRGVAAHLPLALAGPSVAARGLAELSSAARIVRAWPDPDGMRVDVLVSPRSTASLLLTSIAVSCEALRLGNEDEPAAAVVPTSGDAWLNGRRVLALRARPGGPPGLRVVASAPLAVPLQHVGQRGEWVHVRAVWSDGSRVEGWTERRGLVPAGGGFGWGAWGPSPVVRCSRPRRVPPEGGYAGPATLRAGAKLWARPGRGPWAEALQEVTVDVEAADLARDPWVRVVRFPGISETDSCGQLEHAWAMREQVTP